jgi:hypothetical protein
MDTTLSNIRALDADEIDQVDGGNPALIGAAFGFIVYKWVTTDWSDLPGGVSVWQGS